MIHSKALLFGDFESAWYKKWGRALKQTESGRGKFKLHANKFWQNAAMSQALYERGALEPGNRGIGFGVGKERLPALFASMNVNVLATDQDFKSSKAAAWDNDQLSHGSRSLNVEKICPPKLFSKNVEYQAVDMKKIPKSLNSKFNFLWSNCALGHLGSIEDGQDFIQKSLKCLKPGGWAVHTTEANIISDKTTLDNAGTVFFRQRDLYHLFTSLSRQGYQVEALRFNLGSGGRDFDFTLAPEWGSDHSKILFDGHMATQIILIIHKPLKPLSNMRIKQELAKHRRQYSLNLLRMRSYRLRNRSLSKLLKDASAAQKNQAKQLNVLPGKKDKTVLVKIKPGETKRVRIPYQNNSKAGLFKPHASFTDVAPVVLATYRPVNRSSKLSDKSWHSSNRPAINFLDGSTLKSVEYVKPGYAFVVEFYVSGKKLKPGKHSEWVGLVKEGEDIIPSSEAELVFSVA